MHIAFIEGRKLTDEERAEAALVAKPEPGKFTEWPEGFEQRNSCTDPCDMWDGPCACGAWHTAGR